MKKLWLYAFEGIAAAALFGGVLFAYLVMDMTMEGNALCYPQPGYLLPGVLMALIFLIVTFVAKKRKYQGLKRAAIAYYVITAVFTIACFPVVPMVCYQDGVFAAWCRVCVMVNLGYPLLWLV